MAHMGRLSIQVGGWLVIREGMIPHLCRATKTSMRLMLYVGDVAYSELWLDGHEF